MRFPAKALVMMGTVLAAVMLFLAAVANAGDYAERPSPHDRLSAGQVHVYDSQVVVDLENATKVVFTDTNSMEPLLDAGKTGLEIALAEQADVHVGDIVSYNSGSAGAVIIHEVVAVGSDDEGWYAVTKGYNAGKADPEKVRFHQIRGVLVALFL